METTRNNPDLDQTGKNAYAALVEMVAALECDYDRLEELREERDCDGAETWADANPEHADELTELTEDAGECADADDARQRIEEDALSVEVGGWWAPGSEAEATEYRILLTTGGPAVRITGELSQYNEPGTARLEVQDWGTPWTEYCPADSDVLLTYAQCFFFGE